MARVEQETLQIARERKGPKRNLLFEAGKQAGNNTRHRQVSQEGETEGEGKSCKQSNRSFEGDVAVQRADHLKLVRILIVQGLLTREVSEGDLNWQVERSASTWGGTEQAVEEKLSVGLTLTAASTHEPIQG